MKEEEAEDFSKGLCTWPLIYVVQHQQITRAHISIAKEISSITASTFITGILPGMRWLASNCIEYPLSTKAFPAQLKVLIPSALSCSAARDLEVLYITQV